MRVNIHTHMLPARWPDLAERYGDGRWPRIEHIDPCSARIVVDGRRFRDVDDRLYNAGRRLAEMDATGIDQQILSTVPVMFSYWAPPKHTLQLCRHLNEHLAEVVSAHPDRFSAFGTVPLNDPKLAVAELERCVLDLRMVGVEIGTNIAGLDLDDPSLLPFFHRAGELGAIVFVHPWQVVGAGRLERYYMLYTVAMPSETAFAVGAVIFGGLFERIPELAVVFAHGGGSAPFIIGRMERGWSVWEQARERLSEPPSDALRRCHFDSLTWDTASLGLLVARVGADRIMLGSDFPFLMAEERPGEMIEAAGLSEEDTAAILGGNACRLLSRGLAEQLHG